MGKSFDIRLFPTQSAYVNSKALIVAIIGPAGEGKTYASVAAMMVNAKKNGRPVLWAIIRDTHTNIKRSTVRSINKMFREHPNLIQWGDDNRRLLIKCSPKIEIDLFGIDDPGALNRLQGTEYDGIWLEEPAAMLERANSGLSEEVFNDALLRAVRAQGDYSRLQISMNPADEDHWTFSRLVEAPDMDPENPLITKEVLFIPPGENKLLKEKARQAAKAAYKDDPAAYARYVLGQFAPVYRGERVTPEYNAKWHRWPDPIIPAIGLEGFRFWDGWHNPAPYDSKTEVLTRQGWKFIKDVVIGEDVITLNPDTKEIEYLPVRNTIAKEYNGNMYHWKHKSVDLRTTEDHNLVVLKQKTEKIVWKKAKDVESHRQMLKRGKWLGETSAEAFVLPEYQNGSNKFDAVNVEWETFCAFMGIYLSEGSTSSYKKRSSDLKVSHYEVRIYQKERKESIEKVLIAMPFKWTWFEDYKSSGWRANSVQLHHYLKRFGKSHEKYVPEEIKLLSPEYIKLFLEFYLIGDGIEGRRIYTSSKLMADDLQELVLKAGWSATISIKNDVGREFVIREGKYKTNHVGYIVNFALNTKKVTYMRENLTISKADNEMVYCVDVAPNHIIYVRRNGKPCWCGNCIIGQRTKLGRLIHIDTLQMEGGDIGNFIDMKVLPLIESPRWKDKCFGWRDIGDRTMLIPDQSRKQNSPAKVIEEKLGGRLEPGPSQWTILKLGIKRALNMNTEGMPTVLLSPTERILHKGLNGAWHYKTGNDGKALTNIPNKKDPISHPCEAWANGVCVMLPVNIVHDVGAMKFAQAKMKQRAGTYAVRSAY